ncbi:flagellar FliJ family protein [Pantoea sp. B65]|uniref:flagellar FliJ family protein n=1 Tax=Pantoea sp. B65 TaxID=2813359 RepID=UPI0039B49AD4
MFKTRKTIATLEQLRLLRERAVSETSGKLVQQQQLCQRYHNNIDALNSLSSGDAIASQDATQMHNLARYKANIQRVIDWQKQEHALAQIEQQQLQQDLILQACREKTVEVVLQQQQAALLRARNGQEQKITDGQAMQSWLRHRRRHQ